MNFRIGYGYDVHRLGEGLELWLGGVKIDHNKGAIGHSDADVLLHAICDALLGAANLGDIGQHFPDTSNDFKNISSIILLRKVVELLNENSYFIQNIDSTIILQEPKISSYIPEMKKQISTAIVCDEDLISIKATTTEGLGFAGRGEGIAASAVVLIQK